MRECAGSSSPANPAQVRSGIRSTSPRLLTIGLLAACAGCSLVGAETATAADSIWTGGAVEKLMAVRMRDALTGNATPVENLGDLESPDFKPQRALPVSTPRRAVRLPTVQLASLAHDLIPMSLPPTLVEPRQLPRYPDVVEPLERKDAKQPGVAAVLASLGREFTIPELPKEPSLSGHDKINWAASPDCLAKSLRAVLVEVAEKFGPIRVNSTCRSKKHNAKVGGAKRSYHLTGNAADFRVYGQIKEIHDFLAGKRGIVGGLKHYGFGIFHIDNGPRRTWATPRRFRA